MSNKVKGWIADGVSIDETRVSFLMIATAITIGFAMWKYSVTDVIDDNMLTLIGYELTAITSINIANIVKKNTSGGIGG